MTRDREVLEELGAAPTLVRGAPGPALHTFVAEGHGLALTTAPEALPIDVIARPLAPPRTLAFELLWRDETPSAALSAFIGIAAETIERIAGRSAGAGGCGVTSVDELETLTRQASGRRLLSADEEVELAKADRARGHEGQARMIESNLRLVFAIARSYRGPGPPSQTWFRRGRSGSSVAVEKFDHRRGLKFSTYAVWWIRRLDARCDGRRTGDPDPAKANQQLAAVRRAGGRAGALRRGPVSTEAIAARAGLGAETVRSLRGAARVTASLDEASGRTRLRSANWSPTSAAVDPLESAIAHEERREVTAMLRLLPGASERCSCVANGLNDNPAQSHEQSASGWESARSAVARSSVRRFIGYERSAARCPSRLGHLAAPALSASTRCNWLREVMSSFENTLRRW